MKTIPSVVQLPGGVRLEWVLFAHEEQIRAPGRAEKFK